MKTAHIIAQIRSAGRGIVRQQNFLHNRFSFVKSNSETHAIVELDLRGVMHASQLAAALNLEKSTISRLVMQLAQREIFHVEPDKKDGRHKLLSLTDKGREVAQKINSLSNAAIQQALDFMNEEEKLAIVRGMSLYAKALKIRNYHKKYTLHRLAKKDEPQLIDLILLVREEFDFETTEILSLLSIADIPHIYDIYRKDTLSNYYMLTDDKKIVGGVGYSSLATQNICILKDMYISPYLRRVGIGTFLLQKVLQKIEADGFTHCYVATHQSMHAANALYKKFGFQPAENPLGTTKNNENIGWYIKEL